MIPLVHEIWIASLRAQGRRPTTLANYQYAVDGLAAWRQDLDLTTVEKFEALRYTAYLNETYEAGGVRNRLKALRNFYSWAVREELCEANPFMGIVVRASDEAQPSATDEQINSMLASAKRNVRDLTLCLVLVDTGCRKAEAASLEVRDIDLTSGMITFRVSKTRPRTVPMSDRLVVSMSKWLRRRGVGSGSLWSVGDPYSLVKQCCKRHSNSTITPHACRRHFAISWMLAGGSETSLMRLLGWSSRTMIQVYIKASQDAIAVNEYKRLMA